MNKKWLYFTRSDGQIDSMPNNAELDTADKRRAFIGDSGANRFSIQDGCGINPIWDGSKYISDPAELKNTHIKESESIRDELLEDNAVEIRPGIFLRTRLKDYPIFDDLLKRLAPGDIYPNFTQEYPRGTWQVFDVSYEEFEAAYDQGALQQMQIRQAHGERVKEIQAG